MSIALHWYLPTHGDGRTLMQAGAAAQLLQETSRPDSAGTGREATLHYLGQVARDDIIVQVADFCLQFEGVEWVAVAGKLGNDLVIAVRNYGMSGDNAGEARKFHWHP